jgi:hypothetical protein
MDRQRPPHHTTHVAFILAVAALIGFAAAVLAFAGGADIANAVLTGGGATGGTATLLHSLICGVRDN